MWQIFYKTRVQMKTWCLDNPHTFGDQVYLSNPLTTSLGMVTYTTERFAWHGTDDLRAKIEPPSCQQYNPGDFKAIRPLNWDVIIDEPDADDTWVDPGAPSRGRSCPGDGNDNVNGGGKEDMKSGEKGTGNQKETHHGKWKCRGKGKGNGQGKAIVKQTPGGNDISVGVAFLLQKEKYEPDSDTEG
jgi:hypothetical protein